MALRPQAQHVCVRWQEIGFSVAYGVNMISSGKMTEFLAATPGVH